MSNEFPTERERMTREQRQEQREAKDAERRLAAEQAMRERQLAQEAFTKTRERLKADRLAREASAER
jgi:hypothetical protein